MFASVRIADDFSSLWHAPSSLSPDPPRGLDERGCPDDCWLADFLDEPSYAYLLGRYLGDGQISATGGGFSLRITCSGDHANLIADCVAAIAAVAPGTRSAKVRRPKGTEVHADSSHWPCLLPHGPVGRRDRLMALRPWQRRIILDRHPESFLRGLVLAPTRHPKARTPTSASTTHRPTKTTAA